MAVDHEGAPWPYSDDPAFEHESLEPNWACPEGVCECHPVGGDGDRIAHTLILYDESATVIPDARCRVFEDGQLINESPYADPARGVVLKLKPTTRSLYVEWAPHDVPLEPRYPYRQRYHVELGRTLRDGVRRRLHNLGFSACRLLEDNVRDFQHQYGPPVPGATGRPKDIAVQLGLFHDATLIPPLDEAENAPSVGEPSSSPSPSPTSRALLVRQAEVPGSDVGALPAVGPGGVGGTQRGPLVPLNNLTIIVVLQRLYALDDASFDAKKGTKLTLANPTSIPEPDLEAALTYDLDRMVKEIDGARDKSTGEWKWLARPDGLGGITDASVTLRAPGVTKTEKTQGNQGAATFRRIGSEIAKHAGGAKTVTVVLSVEPPKGQKNAGGPAGVGMTNETTNAGFLYRPFSMSLVFDNIPGGKAPQATIVNGKRPAFAKVLSTRKTSRGLEIHVDWRPDWVRGVRRLRTVRSRFNPFQSGIDDRDFLPAALMLHDTVNATMGSVVAQFSDRTTAEESAHYIVDYDGHVVKMVDEHFVSNHAGRTFWQGWDNLNDFSVGIEIIHEERSAPTAKIDDRLRRFTVEQYESLLRICDELRRNYQIRPDRIIAHSDAKIGRTGFEHRDKFDPGLLFEWSRFAEPEMGITLVPVRYEGNDPDILDLRGSAETYEFGKAVSPSSPAGQRQARRLSTLRRLLYEIGHSVTTKAPGPALKKPIGQRPTHFAPPATFSGSFDQPLQQAVRVFQMRWFSGNLYRYSHTGHKPLPPKPAPLAGLTIDPETQRMVVDVWNAAQLIRAAQPTP